MKPELKVFNDLIDTVIKHSCNNEANITDVSLWADAWKKEMTQALSIAAVGNQRELLQAFQEKYNEENTEEDVQIYDHHIDDFINSL